MRVSSWSMRSSSSSAARTSYWLPTETNRETPRPARAARVAISEPSWPLWETMPIRPGVKWPQARLQVGGGVEDAEAVRADQPRPGRGETLAEAVVVRDSGGDGEKRAHPAVEGLRHDRLDVRRRDAQDDELGGLGQRGDRRVGRVALDLPGAAVDQPDRAPVGAAERALGDPVAPLGMVVGGADDGDRARVTERSEVACAGPVGGAEHGSPCLIDASVKYRGTPIRRSTIGGAVMVGSTPGAPHHDARVSGSARPRSRRDRSGGPPAGCRASARARPRPAPGSRRRRTGSRRWARS